jgi:hypothetical protein
VIEAVRWTLKGDDAEAAEETRRRGRLAGPDATAFLHYVMATDYFASPAQRVRAATVLLEVGEFLSPATKGKPDCFTRQTKPTAPTRAK